MAYVMAFIKKYTALLIPVGILLLVLLLLIPTILTGKALRKDMEEISVRQGKSVRNWIDKAPSSKQSTIEEAYQDEHARDVDAVELQVRQSTMRELASYQVFPVPVDTSVQVFIDFGKKFRGKIDSLVTQMNARSAPTDQEVHLEILRRGGTSREDSSAGYSGRPRSARSRDPLAVVTLAIRDAFLEKRASQISLYASANLFGLYDYWENFGYQGPKAIEDCWYSQLALWVHEDIADTIASMNSNSKSFSVLTSPVKRLVGVSFLKYANYFIPSKTSYNRMSAAVSVEGDFPAYLSSSVTPLNRSAMSLNRSLTPQQQATSVLGVKAWTTRKCNEDTDVIHFSVSVVVESNAVFSFMEELCREKEHKFYGYDGKGSEETFKHNQITIMQFLQEPVDRQALVHSNYHYGDAAVVKLNLVCEYIFHRIGYDDIKPQAIKDLLNPPTVLTPGGRGSMLR
ncbi:MAG: hypothetical protein FVQ79_09550 [Planctomycetes bacterium]|nr:hypothetical protein [Planctomycetota bacterium]